MDKSLEKFDFIKQYLESNLSFPNRHFPGLKDEIIVDENREHLLHILRGWDNDQYLYKVLYHVQITEDEIIAIHHQDIDKPLIEELVALGIPAEGITLNYAEKYDQAA